MKRTKQLLSLILAFTITIISCSVNVKAAEPAQKTSIDGMDDYISINDDGYAVLDSSAALNAGYTDKMIEYVQGNLNMMNAMAEESGKSISSNLSITVYTGNNLSFHSSRASLKGVSKVVTTWRSVKIYMNNLDTLIYCSIIQRYVDSRGNLRQTLSDYAAYKGGDPDIERAAYIAGLNALLASWYLFPAQQAAQPGRGIIMQTDVDYGTMTSTVSFLSQ